MPTLNELKKQVQELEAQANSQQQEVETVPVPAEPAPQPDKAAEMIAGLKAYFEHLFSDEERQPEFVEATNVISKCCPVCYLTQAIANECCTLCGTTPESWLLAEDDEPTPAGRAAYEERTMFKRMAANSTVEELKTALRSGWATSPARESFAKRLLELREAQTIRLEATNRVEEKTVPTRREDISSQVKSAVRLCEIREAEIARELEELRATSGQSGSGQNK